MYRYIVLEIRRTLRDSSFLIFGTGMPVMMYLLFTNIGGGTDVDGWRTASMVGMAAYGALGSAMSIGTGVASDKTLGWLEQLRVTPLSPSQAVVGRAISGSVTVLPTIFTVLLAGGLVNGVRLDAWQWIALAVLLWIGALPFTMLGLGNGYRLTPQGTGVVNVACLMGFGVVGGLWFPLELLPGWLRSIGRFTPANRFADLGWATTEGHAPGVGTVAVLSAWLLLFGTYAVVSYRRSARTV
ncbi:ABC transporter permease [Streptomyces sp. NBC_00378]|uniref:ABC transporter permease n=1 Tax=unclassified Streptomyces TaxID=2593676 RepID=UPI002254752F|nr:MULTISPECIES: ABC transporter permease [unclassified Streptomyces]MCX5114501.1 ABC transporter permease [Streptomyces sp. NBC_00378]